MRNAEGWRQHGLLLLGEVLDSHGENLKLVRNRSFASFVLYRPVLGVAVLAFVAAPVR